MVSLVGRHFSDFNVASGSNEIYLCHHKARHQGLAVTVGPLTDSGSQHVFTLQIDDVFRLVAQVRAAVLHLDNATLRVRRRHPFVIRNLLFPLFLSLLVESPEVFIIVDFDSRFFGQTPQVLLPVITRITTHDRLHRGIRFQSRRVNTDLSAIEQFLPARNIQHKGEDLLMHVKWKSLANPCQTRMFGGLFRRSEKQKVPQGKAIGATPRDAPL